MASSQVPSVPRPTLGTIFRAVKPVVLADLSANQRRAFHRLATCRTPVLGGAIWRCDRCNTHVAVYHSCRDRHCPLCQATARAAWVDQRLAELLPIPYFHLVFTVPDSLNPLIAHQPRATLNQLFQSVRETLLAFAKRHWQATPAITMVLHTWGSKLNRHVHLHCIVSAGGLGDDRQTWRAAPRENYLFPVRALSSVFRGKFMAGLAKRCADGQLPLPAGWTWQGLTRRAYRTPWVVYAKRPFGGPAQVIKYLGRYTHRVAIANNRILAHANGLVAFTYTDYKRGGKKRVLRLRETAFCQRFLGHVLPKGLVRIRYAGLLANRNKQRNLAACRAVLGEPVVAAAETRPAEEEAVFDDLDLTNEPIPRRCPTCGKQRLRLHRALAWTVMADARAAYWNSS